MTRGGKVLVWTALLLVVVGFTAAAIFQLLQRNETLQRTLADAWITTKIEVQYLSDANVWSGRIAVRSEDRTVTLSGPVRDKQMRQEAVAIAETTDGVYAVIDRMWRQGEAAPTTREQADSPVPDPGK